MPVLLDLEKEVLVAKRDLDSGVPLELGGQSDVVLTKYITTNPQKACWAPADIWEEQVTVDVGGGRRSVRIGVPVPGGGVRSVNVDDGLIIDLEGRLTGVVGLLPGRAPMEEEECQAYIDQNDKAPPMYQR